ncbi:GxGYxYP family putative glycoside hydrolase [Streptomyces sp. WMMC500]|uniref:GxGYxYP domain-containing protein n=1 Tax=Streptomyces sp. WMMC500 TaxID=3015154 RepID=UPI00248BA612|nr:GxGYxYP domain-containing protein [Streptomyces sp. WMMC500]WBB57658.1 GxGYxYP family putative glycoside hydrolase [Streptomyces sp. WMMC500]
MIRRRTLGKAALATGTALALAPGSAGAAPARRHRVRASLPKGTPLQALKVIPSGNLTTDADRILVSSLQGLVARTSPEQIFIDEGGPGAVWKNSLHTYYGIGLDDSLTTWQGLLTHFRDRLRGYVRYDRAANVDSVNVASALSGPLSALPVDRSQEAEVQALGLTRMLLDVSGRDERWAYETYGGSFSRTTAAELNPNVAYHLRDYLSLTDAFTFYDGVSDWRADVLAGMAPGATLMGYGDSEIDMISQASGIGITSIPSDLAPNLSALSSIHSTAGLRQKPQPAPATRNKHYVTFVISDGDNVAANLWSQHEYFTSPDRGDFSLGYGLSPSLVDLAPAALRWYYDNARAGSAKDHFIAGPSGNGYTFPSRMPRAELNRYTERLNTLMATADMGICEILDDQDCFADDALWQTYLRHPAVDALFYFGPGAAGGINWVAGKPVIAQRSLLWEGLTEQDELIREINARPAAPASADGYTLVLVHCWSKSMADVRTVVDGLRQEVEVVTPAEFVHLVNQNHAS